MAHRKETQPQDAHINVRLPYELAKQLRERAKAQERSVSGEVRVAVSRHLEQEQAAA